MQDAEYFTNHKILLYFQKVLHIFFKKKIIYQRSVLSLMQPSSNSYGCPKSRQNKTPKQISSLYFLQMLGRHIHCYLLRGIYGMSCQQHTIQGKQPGYWLMVVSIRKRAEQCITSEACGYHSVNTKMNLLWDVDLVKR